MNDLGRRYYIATSSNEGRRRLGRLVLIAALAINLIAGLLPLRHAFRPLTLALYVIGLGMVIVAVVLMYLNRKAV